MPTLGDEGLRAAFCFDEDPFEFMFLCFIPALSVFSFPQLGSQLKALSNTFLCAPGNMAEASVA